MQRLLLQTNIGALNWTQHDLPKLGVGKKLKEINLK